MPKIQKLKNGLRFINIPMSGTKTAAILVMVGTGSKYENKDNNGISHFLEHMFFKGTKKRPSALAISGELDGVGGVYNAFTGKEYTGYWVKVDAGKIGLAMDVVSDMLLNSKLEPNEIEREKGVIIEEMNMYRDNPIMHIEDLFEECLYGDQPAGWDTIGAKENVSRFKRKDFTEYLQSQYGAQSVVVCLAGNITEPSSNALVNKYFSKLKKSDFQDKRPVVEKQTKPKIKMLYKKTDQAHLSLGVRAFPLGHKDEFVLKVLSVILGGSMSSRLFSELRERRGLAYYVNTAAELYTDSGYLTTQAGVPVNKLPQAVKIVLKEYGRLKKDLVNKKELRRVKDLIKGRSVIQLEASDSVANWYGRQAILRGDVFPPEHYFEKISEVTAGDIRRVARDIFADKVLNLALIGPYKKSPISDFRFQI